MKFKMMVSDVDGTLFRSDGSVSERTLAAIKDYISRGGLFVLNSGRSPDSLEEIAKSIGTDGQPLAYCCFNGALLREGNGKVVYDDPLDPESAITAIEEVKRLGENVYLNESDNAVVERCSPLSAAYERITGTRAKEVGDFKKYLKTDGVKCYKAVAVLDPKNMLELKSAIEALKIKKLQCTSGAGIFVEMMSDSCDKGTALIKAAEYYGIPLSDVIAVGDYYNDTPMIRAAGLGIAVKNAVTELIDAADFVSEYTNDEDAIAHIIEKFCPDE